VGMLPSCAELKLNDKKNAKGTNKERWFIQGWVWWCWFSVESERVTI